MSRTTIVSVSLTVLAVVCLGLVAVVNNQNGANPVVLISEHDLEKASYVDPAEWNQYERLEKEQSSLTKKIAGMDKEVEQLDQEKTKVIVRVSPPGPPGPPGTPGKRGPRGQTGADGLPGIPGVAGIRGPRGPRGPKGYPGPQGHRGFPGPRGPDGPRGDQGPRGPGGVVGDRGAMGPTGRPGPPGRQGPVGPDGSRGTAGSPGPRGPAGDSGPIGPPGQDVNCRWIDVCGICDGDESSCAHKRTPSTCHAVGDPHYRTFDGFTYNYQVTGEFTLAKHLNDFEVQNKQRVCPNPEVRCNMAAAIKAEGHILIWFADWGIGRMMFDGETRNVPINQRVDVNDNLSYSVRDNLITVRYTDATVRVYINPWAYTFYMDIYIDAPARWSTGRSLTGLCWTFDDNYGDDPNVLNVAAQFWVGASVRSFFDNPRPQLHEVGGSVSLLAAEEAVESGLMEPKHAQILAEEPPNHNPHHNVEIAFRNDAERQRVEQACSTAHGNDKRDCMFDMVAGEPEGPAAAAAEVANLIDHEKLLQECVFLRSSPAAMFNSSRLPPPQNHEGFSYAFWYMPMLPATAAVRSVFGKGANGNYEVQVTMPANELKMTIKVGNAQCTPTNTMSVDQWTHVAFTITEHGGLTVWYNGAVVCTNDGGAPATSSPEFLVVGEVGMPPAIGRLGRLYYVPTTFEGTMIRRYSSRQAPGESCPPFNPNPAPAPAAK